MVKREPGEGGDDAYRINATLVHYVLGIAAALTVGAVTAIVAWVYAYAEWQSGIISQTAYHERRITSLELMHNEGIHPIAKERIEYLERRVRDMETRERIDHRPQR